MGYRAKFILGSARLVLSKCTSAEGMQEHLGDVRTEDPVKREPSNAESTEDVDVVARGSAWFDFLRGFAAEARSTQAAYLDDPTIASNRTKIKVEKDAESTSNIVKVEKCDDMQIKTEPSAAECVDPSAAELALRVDKARLHVQNLLLELPGVGRKVADCVALFSLDQTSAVPVDTHVWNIAIRDYAPHLRRAAVKVEAVEVKGEASMSAKVSEEAGLLTPAKGKRRRGVVASPLSPEPVSTDTPVSAMKDGASSSSTTNTPGGGDVDSIETRSLTPAVYEAVGSEFRSRFGLHAGWAHSVLFAAELGIFKDRLPTELQTQMKVFSDLQRSAKKVKREEKLEAAKISKISIE
jgi:hypothetical protein